MKNYKKQPTKMKPKPANVFLKLEDIEIGKAYAFSYNPSAQPIPSKVNSIKEWFDIEYNVFQSVLQYCEVNLYVEISPTGRFHFHGIIIIRNAVQFIIRDVQHLTGLGTSVIKEVDKPEVWAEYITKQQDRMQKLLQDELYGPFMKSVEDITIDTRTEG